MVSARDPNRVLEVAYVVGGAPLKAAVAFTLDGTMPPGGFSKLTDDLANAQPGVRAAFIDMLVAAKTNSLDEWSVRHSGASGYLSALHRTDKPRFFEMIGESVRRAGSVAGAARALGVSHRQMWRYVNERNRELGLSPTPSEKGGKV